MEKHVNEINDSSFENIISKGNVVIDFWAPWCGPCQMLGPIMEEVAEELKGKASVYKMNVDENPQTSSKFGIRGIPTVIMYKEGEVCFNCSGAYPKEYWINNINQHV